MILHYMIMPIKLVQPLSNSRYTTFVFWNCVFLGITPLEICHLQGMGAHMRGKQDEEVVFSSAGFDGWLKVLEHRELHRISIHPKR